jgi:toxin CcdB
MSQFTAYENLNPASRAAYPYFVDVQNTLLESLATRVVVPLARADRLGQQPIGRLCPTASIRGEPHVLLTHQMTAVPLAALKAPVGSLHELRTEIVAAIDFLVTGI